MIPGIISFLICFFPQFIFTENPERKIFITAIRHGQAEHNTYDGIYAHIGAAIRDPYLTELGKKQAEKIESEVKILSSRFTEKTGLALKTHLLASSPLKRTLQTTLIGFEKSDNPELLKNLYINSDLQEIGEVPCDTGNEKDVLEKEFPNVKFAHLADNWFNAERKRELLSQRKDNLKKWMLEVGFDHITIVAHHGFLKSFFGDKGYSNCEVRGYIYSEGTFTPLNQPKDEL
jgi:broad specificity phosphatase PhoE